MAGHNSPLHAHPYPSQAQRTSSTLRRKQQWEPKPPVLPSAAVTMPGPTRLNRTQPGLAVASQAALSRIWIPKNPAERAEALSAEIVS